MYNFSAGPACLPNSVTEQAQAAIGNLANSGIGLLEHSHRGKEVTDVFDQAEASCRQLAGIPDDYSLLFLQGGASLQFCMVAMNFLGNDKTADYIDTGTWSAKAIKEAKLFGNVHEAGSSKNQSYTSIPKASEITSSASPIYTHYTSNNTIAGTEWREAPNTPDGSFLVCDASSNIFSKPIDVKQFGIIYAGAQKNLGPAGVVLVIIKKSLIEQMNSNVSSMLSYKIHLEKESRFNTPPVFGVYTIGKTFEWIQAQGGLEKIGEINRKKASVIYDALDASTFYKTAVAKDSRSLMNITFRAPSEELEKKFIAEADKKGLKGLKGHRSVGGMRASVYNAFPVKGCHALVDFMTSFEKANV